MFHWYILALADRSDVFAQVGDRTPGQVKEMMKAHRSTSRHEILVDGALPTPMMVLLKEFSPKDPAEKLYVGKTYLRRLHDHAYFEALTVNRHGSKKTTRPKIDVLLEDQAPLNYLEREYFKDDPENWTPFKPTKAQPENPVRGLFKGQLCIELSRNDVEMIFTHGFLSGWMAGEAERAQIDLRRSRDARRRKK
jgi:hypothetical protein